MACWLWPRCHTARAALAKADANFDEALERALGERVSACAADVDAVPQQLARAIGRATKSKDAPAIVSELTHREVGALLELPGVSRRGHCHVGVSKINDDRE